MVRSFLLTFVVLGAGPPSDPGAVYGTVRVEGSLEPVPRAMVSIPALGRSTATDGRGYYVLPRVPAGRYQVEVGAFGHGRVEVTVEVPAGESVRLDLTLPVRPIAIEGVGVRVAPGGGHSEVGPGPVRVSGAAVRAAPALVEPDVLRAVQALPSVSVASDFSSALYMRGGSPDQTAVTLDGVPIFNPYHLGGLFGAVDPDIVAGVEVWPGAMPATGEDRISGAVAIRTRDGGRDRPRAQGGVGLISSRASVDGPLPGGTGSYLVSVRRTYLDLFTDLLYRAGITDVTVPYSFTDVYLKVTQDIGRDGSLMVSSYLDTERFRFPERMEREFGTRMDFAWGTRMGAIAYRHLLTPALVGEVRVAATAFRGDFDAAERYHHYFPADPEPDDRFEPVFDSRSRVHDLIGAADLTWHGSSHTVSGGVRVDGYRFDHRVAYANLEGDGLIPAFDRSQRAATVAAYVEDEWSPAGPLDFRVGVRLLHAVERGTALMPRLGARWTVSDQVAFSLGAGRYAQVVQSLRDEEAPGASVLAYDFPAATDPALGLSRAADLVLGGEWNRGSTGVRVDAYMKRLEAIPLPPAPAGDIFEIPMIVWGGFRPASGTARGIEASVRHAWEDVALTIGYALMSADRRVDGERFAPRFERRHSLDMQVTGPASRWGRWTARYQLASGQPYTPILGIASLGQFDPMTGRFVDTHGWNFLVGDHNSARLPGYSRLDAGARWELERTWFGREIAIGPQLNVLNVLNTRNVLVAMPRAGSSAPPVLNYMPQLPFFPTVGVEFRW